MAGSAFAGRASNPLGHVERFQTTFFLLSRTYPDASWSHSRRKIIAATPKAGSPIAEAVLARIAALYAIEKEIRGADAPARQTTRNERSRPLVAELERFLREQAARLSPGSEMGKAIAYLLNHWDGLTLFLDDGCVEMDTNPVENQIRPLTLTRKNSLFAGHDEESWPRKFGQ
ncbi:IS66 family transposase [Bradyrhizobium sp. 8-10B]|uniref:IS66 family transposase n=1 Tax=Bradyrhizobium sp. 8-10B TaxID=3344579 RepID=UPI0035C04A6D